MKKLWEVWKMNKSDLLLALGTMLFGLVFGSILVGVIILIADDADSYAVMGTFMAFGLWIALIVFLGGFTLERRFGMAVGMGETRKNFIIYQFVVMAINTLLEILVLIVMNTVEKTVAGMIYDLPCEFDVISHLIDVRFILAAVVLIPVLSLFLGMLIIKFQKKAFWGLWVVWMAGSLGMANMEKILHANPDNAIVTAIKNAIESISALGITGGVLCGAVIGAVLLAITVAVLRKQAVTQY